MRRLLSVAPPVSASAGDIASGDFNGDGRPDLVEIGLDDSLSVLMNQGPSAVTGATVFASPVTYHLDGTPSHVAVADFNGDGKLDLAVSLFGSVYGGLGGVDMLMGNGDGTFRPAVHVALPGPQTVSALAVADFNGDGKPDLAVEAEAGLAIPSASVIILPGRGDGTFDVQDAETYPVGSGGYSIAAGDFNGDGRPDLLVPNPTDDAVGLMLNEGNGKFSAPTMISAGDASLGQLLVADFAGNGKMDFALTGGYSNGIAVFMGDGHGGFQGAPPITLPFSSGSAGSALVAGDLNNDGIPDLIDLSGSGLSVMIGLGNGTFKAPVLYPAAAGTKSGITLGDFNGDGSLDAVATSTPEAGSQGQVPSVVLVGRGDGTFEAPSSESLDLAPNSVAAADFNGDGRTDLVVAAGGSIYTPFPTSGTGLDLLVQQPDGTFGAPVDLLPGPQSEAVAVGDFNGDGKTDLVAVGRNSVNLLPGNGNGTFGTPITTYLNQLDAGIKQIVVADFNGDGTPDLAVSEWANSDDVVILLGNGDGAFRTSQLIPPPWPGGFVRSIAAGDFFGNGKLDLALTDSILGEISIYPGHGDGTFGAPVSAFVGGDVDSIAAADFNGDGKIDLVFGAGFQGSPSKVGILFGNGDGTFQPPVALSLPAVEANIGVQVADVNGVGRPDVVVTGMAGQLGVLVNQGDGSFTETKMITTAGTPARFVLLSGADGHSAAAVINAGSNSVEFLSNADLNPGWFQSTALSGWSGVPFQGAVATFSPNQLPGPGTILLSPSTSGYVATIDWGDETTSTGAISYSLAIPYYVSGSGPPLFDVDGSHRYATAGSYKVTVTLTPASGGQSQITLVDRAVITNAPLNGGGRWLPATEGVSFTNAAVANVIDPGHGPASGEAIKIDWGDGTPATAGLAVAGDPGQSAPGQYKIIGTHDYVMPGVYFPHVTFRDDLGRVLNMTGSVTVSAVPFKLTGHLSPASDTGPSNNDGITNDNRLVFVGMSDPGSTVQLFALRGGTTVPVSLGSTTADSLGHWTFTAPQLADGVYTITANAKDTTGQFSASAAIPSAAGSSSLVIDTAPPSLVGLGAGPGRGQVRLTFSDALSGLVPGGVVDPANYQVIGPGRSPSESAVRAVAPAGNGGSSSLDSVVVSLPRSMAVLSGRYVLRIAPGALSDRAGNHPVGPLVVPITAARGKVSVGHQLGQHAASVAQRGPMRYRLVSAGRP